LDEIAKTAPLTAQAAAETIQGETGLLNPMRARPPGLRIERATPEQAEAAAKEMQRMATAAYVPPKPPKPTALWKAATPPANSS